MQLQTILKNTQMRCFSSLLIKLQKFPKWLAHWIFVDTDGNVFCTNVGEDSKKKNRLLHRLKPT